MAYIQSDCQSISASLTRVKRPGWDEDVFMCERESEGSLMFSCMSCLLYMLDHGSIKAIRYVQ